MATTRKFRAGDEVLVNGVAGVSDSQQLVGEYSPASLRLVATVVEYSSVMLHDEAFGRSLSRWVLVKSGATMLYVHESNLTSR